MNMKQYLPIFVAALLCVSAASCDRSDPDGSVTIPEKPVFDTSTNAGKQAQHIYDTYGLHCHWDFKTDDYIYELTSTSSVNYTEVDDMDRMAEFLTAFEEKALKVLPIEIVKQSFAHLFICNEIQDQYSKRTYTSTYLFDDESVTALIPMEVKTLGVALGYAGSKWAEADMELLQLRWIEAIFETMLNNAPTPTDFNKAALIDVADISGDAYPTNYSASKQWGWWCIQGGDTGKEGGYQYDWGLLDPPYVGLSSIAYRDGAEVQEIAWMPNPEGGHPVMQPIGKPEVIKADMVLLAMGFLKPQLPALAPNVFVAGDAASGASLVVRAMASGRDAAQRVDQYLRAR